MAAMLALLLFLLSFHAFCSTPVIQGSHRCIDFDPPILDFQEQSVRIPKTAKVYLHNPSFKEAIILLSVSSATAHFYTSFFENSIIPPGGNTSFNVVFHPQIVGNIENTLFVNTSHHGLVTYQMFGVSTPDPYRLRPFIGCRFPINCNVSSPGNMQNSFSEPLQVVEGLSKTGDLHLELLTGQRGGIGKLWEVPISEIKRVTKASLSSRITENNTTVIRIKTRTSSNGSFIILPIKMEVTSVPSIYSSTEMLDFGIFHSQDHQKQLNLYFLNSGTEDVTITSVSSTLSNKALKINFKPVTVKAGKNIKVSDISFHASKAQRQSQLSGKIVLNVEKKSYSKLEIPYRAEVLKGYLWFHQSVTLFHVRDSLIDPLMRLVFITSTYDFAIIIKNITLPEEAKTMFIVQNFSQPTLITPHGSSYLFSLYFRPIRSPLHIDSNIFLITNASTFQLPIRTFTGFLETVALPPSPSQQWVDFGILNTTKTASIILVLLNTNPIEVEVRSWMVSDDILSVELLRSERGNKTTVLLRTKILQNASASTRETIILASGSYAVFRVTLFAQELEGIYDGSIHFMTDYQILAIPVKALVAVGKLVVLPKNIVLPASFPGKIVHQSLSIRSSISQNVTLQHFCFLTDDVRFYYKRLKNNKGDLQPGHKSKIANIYFDASLECGDQCYVGVPFILKSESKPHGLLMQKDMWSTDADLHQILLERWRSVKERSRHELQAVFEMSIDNEKKLHANVTARMTWPSIVSTSSQILFPLTSTRSSSVEEVVLENPADVSVYVQVLPLALYPNSSCLVEKLVDKVTLVKFPISTSTLEFFVHRNETFIDKNAKQFEEVSVAPFVHNLLLLPRQVKAFGVTFAPVSNHSVASLLIIRNNLTVMDYVLVQGQGATESLMVAGKPPGSSSVLSFRITEDLLKHCTKHNEQKQNFTLKKVFNIANDGKIPVLIQSIEISGLNCEGYGFKVVDCYEFALTPNASKDIIIMFTPDFSTSQVEAELRLVTVHGSEFLFTLKALLPYHMLEACNEALPGTRWELVLYITVCVIISLVFLVVIAAGYLEAQGICEPFKKRSYLGTSNSPMVTGRAFDFEENQADTNLNGYKSANHKSKQEVCTPCISSFRGNIQQYNTLSQTHKSSKVSVDLDGLRLRISNNKIKWGMSKSCRQNQPSQHQLTSTSILQQTSTMEGTAALLHSCHPEESMDKDMDQPNFPSTEMFEDQQSSSTSPISKASIPKRKLQHKTHAEKKRTQEQNENTCCITAETSNQDIEANIKEEVVKKKLRRSTMEKENVETPVSPPKLRKKKAEGTKKDNQADVKINSSLELPYVTALENKQRKNFTTKTLIPSALGLRPQAIMIQAQTVPCGKSEDCPPNPLEDLLSSDAVQDQNSSISSETESDSSVLPEWDSVPVFSNSDEDLYKIAMQTMNADPFLKKSTFRTCESPLSTGISLETQETYFNQLNTTSNTRINTSDTTKKNKLSKSVSLPENCSNPSAVEADYDKKPGGSGLAIGSSLKADTPGNMAVYYDKSIWSYEPNSAELWDAVHNSNNVNPLSPFLSSGSNNKFNLSGAFGDMTCCKSEESPPKWPDFVSISPSIWGTSRNDTLNPWHTSSGCCTLPIAPVFDSGGVWSSAIPFSSSIWSPTFTPHTTAAPTNLFGSSNESCHSARSKSSTPLRDTGGTYNPWNSWRPTVNRRASEPWNNYGQNGQKNGQSTEW